jgi:hypothetical protein
MINKRLTCGFSASVFGSFCAERGQTRQPEPAMVDNFGRSNSFCRGAGKIQGHALDLIRAG